MDCIGRRSVLWCCPLTCLLGHGNGSVRRICPCWFSRPEGYGPDGEALLGESPRFLRDRKSTRLNSSHMSISYAVFCLKKYNYKYNASICLQALKFVTIISAQFTYF